jgi:hypothetical protein
VTRTSLLVVSGLAIAAPASAEPCDVTIARAPAELRAAIESALATESHCRVALELRAVSTEGGYYLLARDLHGRVRERIVPDLASATVLVASWAADDELDEPGRAPIVAPAASAPVNEPIDGAPPAPSSRRAPFLGVYGTTGPSGYGVRGEVDVFRRSHWSLGVALAERHDGAVVQSQNSDVFMTELLTTNIDLVGYASYERDLSDAWHVRATLGAGAEIVEGSVTPPYLGLYSTGELQSTATGTTTIPLADASISIDADVGRGFSLVLGVIFDAYVTTPELLVKDSMQDAAAVPLDGTVWWSLFGGLRYEL